MLLVFFAIYIVLFSLTSSELKKVSLQGQFPEKCNETNHGKLVVVKDRQNNDKLLLCAEENKVFVWKTTDGSNPTGEFFNPAYDCSDVLNKNGKAKDGFYWIKLSGTVPKRIWCDMITDGGGWMLIGRTNSSITWTVPSNNTPVEPFGEPHWSSSLGDAPVVDFRVQVATQEDFSATKAHWSFRLQNKRTLKNLFIVNEGGCGRLSPGIGHISYVKDLQTEEIVTTKFRCSNFGTYYLKNSKLGWDMMNLCFQQPCLLGFAFLQKHGIQIDFSGSFSYSAFANTSGISHESTSFVGCVNRKCCGCFGPVGGKKHYCGTECKAKNGGNIVKNVYTWFWVRSSLPKRLWNKCMEYKVNVVQGKAVWYKLYNDNAVPVMGRCNQNEPLVNDGIVVVPNSVADQKVPPATGLMKYRKDNEKLYVRSNETWKVISEEEKHDKDFAELKETLAQIQSQLLIMNKTVSDMKREDQRKSCVSLYFHGERKDGIYTIDPDGVGAFQVWCDMTSDRGGWTVFQRRQNGNVDFYRGWHDYRNGFGDLNGNFWLGLDKIHRLTKSGQNVLRVDVMDFDSTTAHAKYGTFHVASVSDSYTLAVGGYSGTAGDSLSYHNGMKFTTKDRDNDQWGNNCAVLYKSAWWYKSCHYSNLNGQYLTTGQRSSSGINWQHWKSDYRSMKEAEMKTRPAEF